MTLQELITLFQPIIVQIATRRGTGSGFVLRDAGVIVTNRHVVGEAAEVTLSGRGFPQRRARVLFTNPASDLAFLEAPGDVDFPQAQLVPPDALHDGDPVVAIGHPYGLSYTATSGIVSKAERMREGISYIQIDAAINPGNSGGPLVNYEGQIVGINTFIIAGGDNLGFALPVKYLAEDLADYAPHLGERATRCPSCGSMVTAATIDGKYCPECGVELQLAAPEEYAAEKGTVGAVIERALERIGKDPRLALRGPNVWEIQEGSATITIVANEEGFISAEAALCRLPRTGVAALYHFLLRENFDSGGLVFSVEEQRVILGAIAYEEFFGEESAVELIRRVAQQADYYDNVLIEQYGGIPRGVAEV